MDSAFMTLIKLFLVAGLVAFVSGGKLNVARVLLPIFDDFATNFTIQSTDETCFKWSATRDDIIQLCPEGPAEGSGCSTKVLVTTITKDKRRVTTDILAEDVNTRQVLRCVVIVDEIKSLAITTTTKELILEEAPEVFEVRAYDIQGNEFSTLTGVPIQWIISTMGPNKDAHPALRFITFRDSPYETPETIVGIEERNLMGHKVLLEGVKTGMSKVTVKLPQNEYTSVKSNEIQLTVVANLIILPPEVYIMPGDVVSFKIIQTSYGVSEELSLQKSQYYLDVEDTTIANCYQSLATALAEGQTKVVLHDKNIGAEEPGTKSPTAIINVVKPAYMVLSFLPYKNWAALISEQHDILAEVYSTDDRKITLGPDVTVHTQIGEAFRVQERSKNGTWITGWTQLEGTAEVSAKLEGVGANNFYPTLTAVSEIQIYPRIALTPSDVILPWDPHVKPKYDVEIKATGGDGKFLWSSTNHNIGVVNQYGKVHTFSHGLFEISAAMHRNHHNRQTARFHILPPSRLEVVEFVMEAEIGSIIYIHIALYAEKKNEAGDGVTQIPFTQCQSLPFKVKTGDPKFSYNSQLFIEPIGVSCGNVAISSDEVGTSKISVSYQSESGAVLEDHATVTFFKPLTLIHPSGAIVLAVGTSVNLVFSGGPKATTGKVVNKQITPSSAERVRASETTSQHKIPGDEEYTVVNAICLKLGQSDLTVSASNEAAIKNCNSQESSAVVRIICGKPRCIEMQPEIKVADASSCPMDLSADRVVVQSNQDIDLVIKVKDELGREFMNISSLKFDWKMTPKELGNFGLPVGVMEKHSQFGTVSELLHSYQKITPLAETGEMVVNFGLTGYRKDVLNSNQVTSEWPEFLDESDGGINLPSINASIKLYLVDHTIVTPNIVSIYNHPSNKQLLEVKQGSGYYQMAMSKNNIAEVKYLQKSRQLSIKPLSDGDLKLQLIDLCLVSNPAVIEITVVSVRIIRVEMSDKVEIGKCISCIVRMYDEFDNLLTIPNLDMIALNHNFENVIIASVEKKPKMKEEWNLGEVHYIITGTELGDTKIAFSIGEPNYEGYISSAPIELQVFPPLKLYPRNVTMVVGSVMQYSSKGGPQPNPKLEYIIVNEDTAKIDNNGIMKGSSVGQTKVKARALGVNPTTGQKIIYTEDAVDLRVIKIQSLKLAAPLTRFQVGAIVPIWVTGLPDQISPLMLPIIDPSIEFKWNVNDNSIVKIYCPIEKTGVTYEPTDMLTIHLKGLEPGRTTVYMNSTILKANGKVTTYSTSIDIEIFEKLTLVTPQISNTLPLLLSPYSTLQLVTNMDNMMDLCYRLLGEPSVGTDSQTALSSPNLPISVSANGLITSYGTLGLSMIVVTAIDNAGLRQSLTIPVEVKPIHYMMLNVNSNWLINPKNMPIFTIPLGTDFSMEASYFDNSGNKFVAGSVELQVRMSRFDLIRIRKGSDNSSFQVSTTKVGVTGLKVWSESIEKTAYYIKLSVAQNIQPNVDSITAGDVLCFISPVINSQRDGAWSGSDPSLMSIDESLGIAIATGSKGGQTIISHNHHPAASLQIKVDPITDIVFDAAKKILTNANRGQYKAHLLLRNCNNNNKKETNLLLGWDCVGALENYKIEPPFTCELTFDEKAIGVTPCEVFDVSAEFDPKVGKYYCKLETAPESNKKFYNLPTMDVTLRAKTREVMSKSVTMKFIPAFYVPEELLLDDTLTSTLTIMGCECVLNSVEVNAADESIIQISDRHMEDTKLTYTVVLIDYHKKLENNPDFMTILVKSDETNQEVLVMVKVQSSENVRECGSPTCGSSSLLSLLHSYRTLISIIVTLILLLTGSAYSYSAYMQPRVNSSMLICPPPSSGQQVCPSPNRSIYDNTSLNHSHNSACESICYCTRSPEIRRNRRYM